MADFAGVRITTPGGFISPAQTPSLAEFVQGLGQSLGAGLISAALGGSLSGSYLAAVQNRDITPGAEVVLSQLWNRVIVIPRTKDVGFVLAQVQFNVEVWNAYRVPLKTITSVTVTGPGGLIVNAPASFPIPVGPLHSRVFTFIVPQDGDPQIKNMAAFAIAGELGADTTVTGIRIIVFTPDPDWQEPVRERAEYLTQILSAYAGQEQRIQMRKTPRTRVAYRVQTAEKRDNAALEGQLWGAQSKVYGVPFWPDAQPLLVAVNPGDTLVQVTTQYRKFAANGLVVLWRDMHTSEANSIISVAAGSIALSFPAVAAWPADGRTYVIPLLVGRLPDDVALRYLGGVAIEMDADFACEVV